MMATLKLFIVYVQVPNLQTAVCTRVSIQAAAAIQVAAELATTISATLRYAARAVRYR
jgi:hypothetical protein